MCLTLSLALLGVLALATGEPSKAPHQPPTVAATHDALVASVSSSREERQAVASDATASPPAVDQDEPLAPLQTAGRLPVSPAGASSSKSAGASPRSVSRTSDDRILLVEPAGWDARSRNNVNEALSLLPPAVRSALGNLALGPLYVLVNSDGSTLSGQQPYGHAANFFSTNEGRNEVVLYPDQSALTVLHELGHAYNLRNVAAGRYALVLQDPEMTSFLAATGWQVLTPADGLTTVRDQTQVRFAHDGASLWSRLSHDDPLEDFANSFALYFADPQQLQLLSPARYAWFVTHLGG